MSKRYIQKRSMLFVKIEWMISQNQKSMLDLAFIVDFKLEKYETVDFYSFLLEFSFETYEYFYSITIQI